MVVAIVVFVYWFVGFCYVQSLPGIGIRHEWIASAIVAFIWPYIFLVRLFQYIRVGAEIKRMREYRKAEKLKEDSDGR